MKEQKKCYNNYKWVAIFGLMLVIIVAITPNNKSSCASQAAIINQPLGHRVNIVNGITIVNGKPFFPFGFYHVSWKSKPEDLIKDMQDIAAVGFNTIHASATEVNSYAQFLNEADRLGIYVFSEQGIGLVNMVNSFKEKPAVLGWNIADDVDNGKLVPQEVLKFHQQAKLADPYHITYISGYSNKIKNFGNCADVLAMQSYPIGNGDDEISLTYDRVSLVRDAVAPYQKAVYANVQAFAWQNKKQGESHPIRIPTFDEVRNMTYQALLAGAKGIIYYTYHDNDWHLPSHPDLWAGMKTLVPEIKAINSLILNGIFKIIDVGVDKVIAGIWTYQNKALVVILNRSYARQEVSIAIPSKITNLKPMFENHPDKLALNGTRLSGFLKPLDVVVYQATNKI
ncbi:hypothetical protein ACE1CD_22735 [Aerosakkonema sp. BLCC-F183]|uniref:hypothetical protein n=1 Tax=Aerosakkonema sp. BLCC-F183 TaxID=3342834 RepID=UPI0035BB4251